MPDIAALYLRYRGPMFAVAASVLRGTGLQDHAEDAVSEAIASLMASPPASPVSNWEAFLVTAAKRKALDLLGSAAVKHSGGSWEEFTQDGDRGQAGARTDEHLADEVAERVDRQRDAARAWDALAVLDQRSRAIVWEFKALGRPRADVARQFGISGARVSQISTEAMQTLRFKLDEEGDQ